MKLQHVGFVFFFLSGFSSLIYQMVWLRIAFSSFGVITPILSVVISTFMVGLGVGSFTGGKVVSFLENKIRCSALTCYAICELLIGLLSLNVPYALRWGESLFIGAANSPKYLIASASILFLTLLPSCVLIGMTLPLMLRVFEGVDKNKRNVFSLLYVSNVAGAIVGTLLTVGVLIEILGIHNTTVLAVSVNLFIAVLATAYSFKQPLVKKTTPLHQNAALGLSPFQGRETRLLFLTGFCSMGMQVVWTRAFTPVLMTLVYSYALLLCVYLFATWLGSQVYRLHLQKSDVYDTDSLCLFLAPTSLIPLLLNDPCLNLGAIGSLVSIVPFCSVLGYLTPKLIDRVGAENPEQSSIAYGANILGSVLGPLVASYILLATVGIKTSIFIFAIPLYIALLQRKKEALVAVFSALSILTLPQVRSYEDEWLASEQNSVLRRDHMATVVSSGEGLKKKLLVNGIPASPLTLNNKLLAHLPLSFFNPAPKAALAICLGTGTTFRSMLSWGIDATGVDLVPGVTKAFPFYFEDASVLLSSNRAHLVTDDGRRFLRRTEQFFDLITVDPPWPVGSASTGLLYSKEFFSLVKGHLRDGGILHQWIPAKLDGTTEAMLNSVQQSFNYAKVFRALGGGRGYYILASDTPLKLPSKSELELRIPESAKKDLTEWSPGADYLQLFQDLFAQEVYLKDFLKEGVPVITDDRPYNEYFLIRRMKTWLQAKFNS